MAAPPPPPDPAVLIDDLVGEFLVRLPPEDPAVLARASLVSKQWHRVITGPGFRRRFREFHGSPPLLGYIANNYNTSAIRFVPTSSLRPRHADADRRDVRAIHASHGRVLLLYHNAGKGLDAFLSVWDPITDEQQVLPDLPLNACCPKRHWDCHAAVICADGDGCNYTTHDSSLKFKVIFVGSYGGQQMFSCFYSSESDSWSDPISIFALGKRVGWFITGKCVPIGSALYFPGCSGYTVEILQYDLPSHQASCTIPLRQGSDNELNSIHTQIIATEDGRLGVAKTRNLTLRLWVREHGGWEEIRSIELHTLLPADALRGMEASPIGPYIAGFGEVGASRVIFLWTCVGYFTIDLNSGRSKKVGERLLDSSSRIIVPYMSFCTPAPGACFQT